MSVPPSLSNENESLRAQLSFILNEGRYSVLDISGRRCSRDAVYCR